MEIDSSMPALDCVCGIETEESIFYFRRQMPPQAQQLSNPNALSWPGVFVRGSTYGVSAYTTHVTENPIRRRLKNSLAHYKLVQDLKSLLPRVQLYRGFCYLTSDPTQFERNVLVAPRTTEDSLDETILADLMKKYKQTGYFRYFRSPDGAVVQEVRRTIDRKVVSQDRIEIMETPPACHPALMTQANTSLFTKYTDAIDVLREVNFVFAQIPRFPVVSINCLDIILC